MELFEVTEPRASGLLDVGDGHHVFWEDAGNADGVPVVTVHGGPGGGCTPGMRRMFDPDRCRIVQFDQRHCGRSTPHPADGLVDLSTNTTAHLIADMERLRAHLGINRWMLYGVSWGTNLSLAYALEHPDRVSAMLLAAVVTTSAGEVDWITRSMGRVFPEQWARFRDHLPEPDRDGNLPAGYAKLLADPDPDIRAAAALEWCRWEDTHVATYPDHQPSPRYDDARFRMVFATLVTHYWANAGFLADGWLWDGVDRLRGIPAALIHGRLDISGPCDIAWELARRWPDAELRIVGDAGHGGGSFGDEILAGATRLTDGLA